jgi:hydrogenase maturation factor
MKVKIELELSPSEAREIFGLPDFSELHSTITSDLLKKCEQDPQTAFETFIKPSMESGVTGFSAYQKMMASFLKPSAGKADKE